MSIPEMIIFFICCAVCFAIGLFYGYRFSKLDIDRLKRHNTWMIRRIHDLRAALQADRELKQ